MPMQNNTDGGYVLGRRESYRVVILLFFLYMFNYIDRMVITSVFPFIKAEWGLSDTQLGGLGSAVYISLLICTLPVSVLADRWSRRKSIAMMTALWSVATAACALTRNYVQIFTARVFIGLGEAGFAPAGTAMIAAAFPQERQALMMGLWNASIPIGSALGVILGGLIAVHFGWRYVFGLVALPGLLLAALAYRLKDYKTVGLCAGAGDEVAGSIRTFGFGNIVKGFLKTPSLIAAYFGFAGNTFVTTAMLIWLPTYLNRTYGLPMDVAGLRAGLIMFFGLVGAPLGGYLADLWYRRHKAARMWFPAISSATSAVILFVSLNFFRGDLQFASFLLLGVSFMAFIPATSAVTQDVVHPGLRATSFSMCVITQHVFGSMMGPLVVGMISDAYGIEKALLALPLSQIVACVIFLVGAPYYTRDLERIPPITLVREGS